MLVPLRQRCKATPAGDAVPVDLAHRDHVPRVLGSNAHMERSIRAVVVEPVERTLGRNPASDGSHRHPGNNHVNGEPQAAAERTARSRELGAGMLVQSRRDAPGDPVGEPRPREPVGDRYGPELAFDRVNDPLAELPHPHPGPDGPREVHRWVRQSAARGHTPEGIAAFDEVSKHQPSPAPFVKVRLRGGWGGGRHHRIVTSGPPGGDS